MRASAYLLQALSSRDVDSESFPSSLGGCKLGFESFKLQVTDPRLRLWVEKLRSRHDYSSMILYLHDGGKLQRNSVED
jgi:hypothetical protein